MGGMRCFALGGAHLRAQPVRTAGVFAGIAAESDDLLFPDAVERLKVVRIVERFIKKVLQERGVGLSPAKHLECTECVGIY